ncbi:MAG: hypothetical protein ABJO86_05120 [Lentilitoribacter sp.]
MIDGIYTAYLTGIAGQAMAMFVFKDGKIGGADMIGVNFSGEYLVEDGCIRGEVKFNMPAQSVSITGTVYQEKSEEIKVPIELPEEIDPNETYAIKTPMGLMNAKFHKNAEL